MSSTVPGTLDAGARQARIGFVRQMNLRQLQERAQALARTLDGIIEALQLRAGQITWPDVLGQFTLLDLQYQQVVHQLSLQLKYHAVFPKAVNESNAAQLPVLLATKLLPDMDADEAALLARHAADAGHLPVSNQLGRVDALTTALNRAVGHLTAHSPQQAGSGALDPRGPQRQALSRSLRSTLAPKSAPSQTQPPTGDAAESFLLTALGRQKL
ncbi:hypothetical protein WJX73_006461 [Symbiochloris irregularis]|uniref:Mediator of RNA polymerase II transcription subunit 8 n=1 Tax=Symbiochloris irregularis TaxID=706552 RepID=A0AAW1P0C1_9CHLO